MPSTVHSHEKKHHNMLNPMGLAPVIAALMLLFCSAAAFGADKRNMPPPFVKLAIITEKEVNPPTEYVGRVEAIQSVDLKARVQGYLEEVHFKEGGKVTAGDLLYVIEQPFYAAQVNMDKAKCEKARATLNLKAQYLERLHTTRSGAVSATDMDTAKSELTQAEAALKESEAALKMSELDLGYTTIKAPITGRIGVSHVTKGNLVGPESGTLARIVQLNPIRVVYSVSEADAVNDLFRQQSSGMDPAGYNNLFSPQIRLPNGKIYKQQGRIDFYDNQVDRSTGTIAVRAVFENPAETLLPGQYVNVLIRLSDPEKMPAVPQVAVMEDMEGKYVFVVDKDHTAHLRRIVVGKNLGIYWAVTSGLAADDSVVVEGLQKVRPGFPVTPMKTAGNEGGPLP